MNWFEKQRILNIKNLPKQQLLKDIINNSEFKKLSDYDKLVYHLASIEDYSLLSEIEDILSNKSFTHCKTFPLIFPEIVKMEIEAGLREKSGAKKGPPQKIKPKDIRKHMQDDWQMESVEDMEYKAGIISKDELKVIKEEKEKAREAAEKELARQEAKDNKSWIARFKKWHDQSKDISIAERNTMSEVIVRQIKEAERSTRDKIQNERD